MDNFLTPSELDYFDSKIPVSHFEHSFVDNMALYANTSSNHDEAENEGSLFAVRFQGALAVTPPPFNARLSAGGGGDRFLPGGPVRNGLSLFGSNNNLFGGHNGVLGGGGGKHRHNSIDQKPVNRSKMLEEFR